ncbi:MAG: GDCCVxC domain-containing (seleno)protein [Opitutales bacterium]
MFGARCRLCLLWTKQKYSSKSTFTCPECGHCQTETMPTHSCRFFWDCPQCGAKLKPKAGDCCVFCSFGDVPCPPIQADRACCD